jgi:hypothetical protein
MKRIRESPSHQQDLKVTSPYSFLSAIFKKKKRKEKSRKRKSNKTKVTTYGKKFHLKMKKNNISLNLHIEIHSWRVK